MTFAKIEEFGINGKQACFQYPGAQSLRRQRSKMPYGVGIERDQPAKDDQQNLQRECVVMQPIGKQ